jgi:hypothetical protein
MSTLEPTSRFLSWPGEIRDCVYEYALGDKPRRFRHGVYEIMAFMQHAGAQSTARSNYNEYIRGLPRWLIVCEQILTEAIEVFSRTRFFEAIPGALPPGASPWFDSPTKVPGASKIPQVSRASPINPLLINCHGLRNIIIAPVRCSYFSSGPPHPTLFQIVRRREGPTTAFLDLVERLGNRNLCLELHWDRWWSCKEAAIRWNQRDEDVLDVLGAEWIGRFRQVGISMAYYTKKGDGLQGMMEYAETCARRLVGGEQETVTVVWKDEQLQIISRPTGDIAFWTRRLVLQRKI